VQGFFSWEDKNYGGGIKPYMPKTKITPLGPLGIGLMSPIDSSSQTPKPPNLASPQSVPRPRIPQAAEGGNKKKTKKESEDEETRPSDTYEPDYSSHETSNVNDPLNPDNYEWNPETGQFESKLHGPLDTENWRWDSTTNTPVYTGSSVFDPGNYQGTIYDPSNPFDLTESEWVTLQGVINSGSLLEEGLGLAKNAALYGGLSDMGGVADEILAQPSAGGLMDTVGEVAAPIMFGLGAYNLANNPSGGGLMSTAIGGVELAGDLIGNAAMSSAGSTMGPIAWGMLELSGHGPITGTLLPMAFGGAREPEFLHLGTDDYFTTTDGDFTYVMGRNADGSGYPVARYDKQTDRWQRANHEYIYEDNNGLNESGSDISTIFTGWSPSNVISDNGEYWVGGQHARSDYFSLNDLNTIMQRGDSVEYSEGMLGAKDPNAAWSERQYVGEGDEGGTSTYYVPPGDNGTYNPYSFLYNEEEEDGS